MGEEQIRKTKGMGRKDIQVTKQNVENERRGRVRKARGSVITNR